MVKQPLILVVLATLLLSGCDKLDVAGMFYFKCPDVRTRFKQSMEFNDQHGYPTVAIPYDDYRVYVAADVHTDGYPANFAEMIRRCNADSLSRFYLVLGDIVSSKDNLALLPDIMPITPGTHPGEDTAFVIPGNHDNYFDVWEAWIAMFHRSAYYVTAQTPHHRDLYIMLDVCSGTLGDTQMAWLRDVLATVRPGCRHCVVCFHNNLFRTDHSQIPSSNLPLEETYALLRLLSDNSVYACLSGHDHFRGINEFEGVTYITLDDIKDDSPHASYLTLDMGATTDHTFVRLGEAEN